MEVSYLQLGGLFLIGYLAGVFRKNINKFLNDVKKWAEETKAKEDARKKLVQEKKNEEKVQ